MKKVNNKKGFTLAELLVVIAILAILVAIAIPVFNGASAKAKQAVTDANFRAAKAEAMVKYTADEETTKKAYNYEVDENGNITLTANTDANPTETKTDETHGIVIIGVNSYNFG